VKVDFTKAGVWSMALIMSSNRTAVFRGRFAPLTRAWIFGECSGQNFCRLHAGINGFPHFSQFFSAGMVVAFLLPAIKRRNGDGAIMHGEQVV